jgi:hypothetical protein
MDQKTGDPILNPTSQQRIEQCKVKSSRFLTERNLQSLQEQLQPPTVIIARDEVLLTTDSKYPWALRERGCFLLALNDARRSSNYETIKDALNKPRPMRNQ